MLIKISGQINLNPNAAVEAVKSALRSDYPSAKVVCFPANTHGDVDTLVEVFTQDEGQTIERAKVKEVFMLPEVTKYFSEQAIIVFLKSP